MVLLTSLQLSEMVNAVISITLGAVSLVSAVAYIIYRKKKHGAIKTDLSTETKKSCLYFFTSVPMIIFELSCIAICIIMMFA